MKNTELELRYVDASGHKAYETVVLDGAITQEQIDAIRPHLEMGESIIAHQVGLPTPAENFEDRFDFPTEDDHVWTDLEAFVDGEPQAEDLHTDDPNDGLMSVDAFVEMLSKVEWDVAAEMERLGIPT